MATGSPPAASEEASGNNNSTTAGKQQQQQQQQQQQGGRSPPSSNSSKEAPTRKESEGAESTDGEGASSETASAEGLNGSVFGVRRGKCKWFNVAKGWGFITPSDGGQDVFVHQSVIKMMGFRSLGDEEEIEFECKVSDKGLEATMVQGIDGNTCKGSHRRPMSKKKFRRLRCYNCGEFANHIASKCNMGPQPKKCHHCKSEGHLIADCPNRRPGSRAKSSASSNADSSSSSGQHGGNGQSNGGAGAGAGAGAQKSSSSSPEGPKNNNKEGNSSAETATEKQNEKAA